MRSWKTTVAGISAILAALAGIGSAIGAGTPIDYPSAISAIIAGIGLITAKDANVSGPAK